MQGLDFLTKTKKKEHENWEEGQDLMARKLLGKSTSFWSPFIDKAVLKQDFPHSFSGLRV